MTKVTSNHVIDENKRLNAQELRREWEEIMDKLSLYHRDPENNHDLFEQMQRDSETAFEVLKMENAKTWSWHVTD